MRLESANLGFEAARAKAKSLEMRGLAIAVVDASGVMVAFQRDNGVPGVPGLVAEAKAVTSAFCNAPTALLAAMEERWPSLTNPLKARLGERFITYAGGQPIVVGGATVGAVGVSGGTPEQDDQVATEMAKAIAEAEAA